MSRSLLLRRLDARTYLIFLLLMSVALLWADSGVQAALLVALGALILILSGQPIKALLYAGIYMLLTAAAYGLGRTGFGTFVIIFHTFSRMVPLVMIATALLGKPPGAVLASFERLRASKNLVLIVCVLLRFFPVLMKEMGAIAEGMAARSVFRSGYGILLRPRLAYECFLVPLLVRCLKLSSELSASAVLRGIESDGQRSSMYTIGFGKADGLAAVLFAAVVVGICL